MPRQPHGRAALYGLDPKALLNYLHTHEEYTKIKVRTKRKKKAAYDLLVEARLINGQRVSATDARTMRRWHSDSKAVTAEAASKMLGRFKLNLPEFRRWCAIRGIQPVLWDRRP